MASDPPDTTSPQNRYMFEKAPDRTNFGNAKTGFWLEWGQSLPRFLQVYVGCNLFDVQLASGPISGPGLRQHNLVEHGDLRLGYVHDTELPPLRV